MNPRIREWLLGPAYFHHRRLIEESKKWDAERIRNWQRKHLSPLLTRYSDAVRDKSEYRENPDRFTRWCLPGFTVIGRTGGTTALPLSFRMDRFARRQKERAYIFDIWSEAGYRPFDNLVVFRGKTGRGLITYNRRENTWILSPSKLTPQTGAAALRALNRIGPFFLNVFPSTLFILIDLLGADAFGSLPIRGVLAGSEMFPQSQMRSFSDRFGFPLIHWYGHSEYAALAKYCPECSGFHFYPTYGYTEFLPLDGDESRVRIVATSFNRIGTQFVRYDTGDLARPSSRTCTRPFERVDAIEGRIQEYFVDRNGVNRSMVTFLFAIHNRFWDILREIQFIQRMPGRLTVRTILKDPEEQAWLEKFLRERFEPVDLDFEYPETIARTATGKLRYFISADGVKSALDS
ncbi:hypothetical protein JXA40_05935 [bacterium]|nr:hypothetical protein [candidate division CSSED10-310 bacterium]